MKTVKSSVFAIGVALCVTPIFGSAYAQSNTDSAAVLLELQTMRSEIAELRDMVERQQFELGKLKQSVAKTQAYQSQPRIAPQAASEVAPQNSLLSGDQTIGQTIDQPVSGLPYEQGVGGAVTQANSTVIAGQPYSAPSIQNGQTSASDVQQQATQVPVESRPVVVVGRAVDDPLIYGTQTLPNVSKQVESSSAGALPGSENINDIASTNNVGLPPQQPLNQGAVDQGQYNQTEVNSSVGQPILAVPNSALPQPDTSGAINANQVPTPSYSDTNIVANEAVDESLQQPTQVSQITPAPVQFTEDQYYDRGFDFLKQSKYDEAINVFNEQIVQYPKGELADDAHYWIAEALFINRRPAEAKPHLRAIIDNYPQSARLPDAMLKTAYIEQDMGNLIEARILLQEIVAKHPSSNAAIAARNRLENITGGN